MVASKIIYEKEVYSTRFVVILIFKSIYFKLKFI